MIISRQISIDNISMVALVTDWLVKLSIVEFDNRLANISAVSLFMGIATFFSLLRPLVSFLLIRLRQLAMEIGFKSQQDSSHAYVDIKRQDEIGDLYRAFKDTSHRLQVSMDELQVSHVQMETLAYRDALTGQANRCLFNQVAEVRIINASELGQKLCVLFLDLDDFKMINDTQGRKAGDRLLETVCKRLLACLEVTVPEPECIQTLRRNYKSIARIGCDEFIALLSHSDNGAQNSHPCVQGMTALLREQAETRFKRSA